MLGFHHSQKSHQTVFGNFRKSGSNLMERAPLLTKEIYFSRSAGETVMNRFGTMLPVMNHQKRFPIPVSKDGPCKRTAVQGGILSLPDLNFLYDRFPYLFLPQPVSMVGLNNEPARF
jgi:hypothetical protein